MKQLIMKYLILVLVMVMGVQVQAKAAEPSNFSIHAVRTSPKFYLSFPESADLQTVKVKIRKADSRILLFSGNISTKKNRLFNLSFYGPGKYEVEIIQGDSSEKRVISLGMGTDKPLDVAVRKFSDHFEVIYVSESGRNVSISMFDKKGNLLFRRSEEADKYRRSFDLSKLEKGRYTLRISDENVVFDETVDVK